MTEDDMWVFCGGMQRSGSTLQFQITAELVESSGRGQRQDYLTPDSLPKLLQGQGDQRRLGVVKTHVFTPAVEAEFRAGRAMGVYIFRDIRDVIVSFMHKENKTFDTAWVNRRIDNNLEWFAQWVKQPRMLVSKYEDVIGNLPAEVARLAEHLGVSVTTEDCRRIADQFSIEEQRKTIEKSVSENKLDVAVGGVLYEPRSLLHTNHIHSGETGGWKTYLTPAQIAHIEARAGKWLTNNGYALYRS